MRSVAVAGRGHDGGADCGPPRQCRGSGCSSSTSPRRWRARASSARAKLKPDPFFTGEAPSLVTPGGFDTDLARIRDCEWILEAIVERLDVKRSLLDKVEAHRAPGAIVSSNTSGIPIGAMAEGRSDDFRKHWLGTHFFNPPRYLKLLEIIPTPDTDPAVVKRLSRFADVRLGKGWSSRRTRPTSSPTTLACSACSAVLEALAPASTPSRKSTR